MALTADAWQTFLKLDAKNKKEIGTNGRDGSTAAKLCRFDAGVKKNPGWPLLLHWLAWNKRKSDDADFRSCGRRWAGRGLGTEAGDQIQRISTSKWGSTAQLFDWLADSLTDWLSICLSPTRSKTIWSYVIAPDSYEKVRSCIHCWWKEDYFLEHFSRIHTNSNSNKSLVDDDKVKTLFCPIICPINMFKITLFLNCIFEISFWNHRQFSAKSVFQFSKICNRGFFSGYFFVWCLLQWR